MTANFGLANEAANDNEAEQRGDDADRQGE